MLGLYPSLTIFQSHSILFVMFILRLPGISLRALTLNSRCHILFNRYRYVNVYTREARWLRFHIWFFLNKVIGDWRSANKTTLESGKSGLNIKLAFIAKPNYIETNGTEQRWS